jgi:hypothetical protein
MKTTLLGLAMVLGATMGCAHGTLVPDGPAQEREMRGSAHVGQQARVIVAGPAPLVHATGEQPVRWFLAHRISGGDGDCAAAGASPSLLSESSGVHLTIAPDHVLCASVAQGTTDVRWHQDAESSRNLWALR